MSKVDAQRAMREARYAAMQAQTPQQTVRRPAKPAMTPAPTEPTTATGPHAESPAEPLCGHRGSGGKPCTRPTKHPEKSHRYT